ncbi:MAG: alpha/beta hydrolase, partial [Lentisphaeria bacterium]|nr:alpha/beta hydrolase [Lentisphaeria bacterium]
RDFSTPLAHSAAMPRKINFLLRTLNVAQAAKFTGLYLFEPYDEKRIPVVFVHGLMSDMRTWGQMLNTLLHDPEIRRKYQFLGFAYSSGNPILVSGETLRRELVALRAKLVEKKCSTEAFDKMVLVGHSMGGLLSRLQITECSPEEMKNIFRIKDAEAIRRKLDPEALQKMEHLITFRPCSFIRRVIFIAVPHRGSEIARSWIGTLGSYMIELPVEIVRMNVTLIRDLVKSGKLQWKGVTFFTGIDNLRPDAPVLQLLNGLKMAESVPCHSIIGNRQSAFTPGGTDGVVPYWSSHLDHVESELIVHASHSAHRVPLAIQEVRRILLKHATQKSPSASVKKTGD